MSRKVRFEVKPPITAVRFAYLIPIKKGMTNLEIPMKKISTWLDSWVKRNFKDQGQKLPGTHKWKPFKLGGRWVTETLAGTKTRYFEKETFNKGTRGARLLQNTGVLRGSFKPFFTDKTAGIGSDVFYAKYHEFGIKERNLPARRMLPLNKEVRPDALKIFERHVRDSIKKGKYPYRKDL